MGQRHQKHAGADGRAEAPPRDGTRRLGGFTMFASEGPDRTLVEGWMEMARRNRLDVGEHAPSDDVPLTGRLRHL